MEAQITFPFPSPYNTTLKGTNGRAIHINVGDFRIDGMILVLEGVELLLTEIRGTPTLSSTCSAVSFRSTTVTFRTEENARARGREHRRTSPSTLRRYSMILIEQTAEEKVSKRPKG